MRINKPVTDNEVVMQDGRPIVTRTNLKGVITYANRAFIEISGFSESELLNKNHNMVRHPDMPPEAFQDLWDTVRDGRPWVGMVKNRCKNGDFYWVEAHVTPIFEHGQPSGYLSVRRKPSRKQIEAADELYASIRCGEAALEEKRGWSLSRHWDSFVLTTKLKIQLAAMMAVFVIVDIESWFAGASSSEMLVLGGAFVVAGALAFNMVRWLLSTVVSPLAEMRTRLEEIAEGNFEGPIEIKGVGEIGRLQRRLKSMQIKLGFDVDEAREMAGDAGRIKQALDNVNANVMMADLDLNIIYVNEAANQMFSEAENDLRNELPNFRAAELLGASIDIFHKDPSHQREILTALSAEYRANMKIGGHSFTTIANPVFDPDGTRLGTVVEWEDRTQIVAVEEDVAEVVQAAMNGDLEKRISLEGKDGFFKTLSTGVNSLVETAEGVNRDSIRVLSALADGKLTEKIDANYQGAFGQLKQDANATVTQLSTIVQQIQTASESVKTGAREIAEGNADLSQRTEEQASSLEQTSSTMAEMTKTVRKNAEYAAEANQLSSDVRNRAEEGGAVVKDAIGAMNEINESSKKIADIISVIDEIAFQTNLLALNASVEAARAGEQGRGFAVVASEVRNLAGRSAEAAKEIKDLIEDSVERVENGSKLVNQSGEVLDQIVEGVGQVSDLVGEIATASVTQSSGIEEVNASVSQMDDMTQQNAALVEEAAASSESLGEQANGLDELMRFFVLPGSSVKTHSSDDNAVDERRSEARPWSRSDSPAPAQSHGAATGTNGDWNEF